MGQLYILDLTRRGISLDKAARGRHRDSGLNVAAYNATRMGLDHPKGPDGRFVDGHPGVSALSDLPDMVTRLSDADLKRASEQNMSLTQALQRESKRRAAEVKAAKPLKATRPAKAVPPAIAERVKAIQKRPMPSDRAWMEAEFPKLTTAQLQSLDNYDVKLPGTKQKQVDELIRRLTSRLSGEAITHRAEHKKELDQEFSRRTKLADERGDREEYAALVAGFGISGTGPGLPPEKDAPKPPAMSQEARASLLDRKDALQRSLSEQYGPNSKGWPHDGDHRVAELDRIWAQLGAKPSESGEGAPAAKPLKATRPGAPSKANDGSALTSSWMDGTFAADIDAVIKNPKAGSAELLRGQLGRLKVAELTELAKKYDVKLMGRTKKEKIDSFVASTVQNKLNSEAIRDQTNFAPKADAARTRRVELAKRLRGFQGDQEGLLAELKANKLTAPQLKELAYELNVDLPGTARTKVARERYIATTLAEHSRRSGGYGGAQREVREASQRQAAGKANLERLAGGPLSDFGKKGPVYLDTPRQVQGTGAFMQGHFHPDGRMGTAWQGLSARMASEDIGGMRLDDALAEAIRMGYDGQPGRIGEQMTRFQEIISQVKDPKVKADLQYAFDRLRPQDVPDLTAKELDDAPEPLMALLRHLSTIPDTGQGGGEAARLVDILRRWSSGELRAGMLDIEVQRLSGFRHESQEGYHEMARAVDKATEALRAMRRDLKRPEPPRNGG